MRENHKVRKAYRKHMLAQVCTLPEEKFGAAFGMQTVYTGASAPEDYYHFRDNGSRVLAVAHLDTVVPRNRRRAHFRDSKAGPMVISGALDDRLGAYVILGLLPMLDIRCDVLLTVGEEWGQSTASYFEPAKEYDWIIEFDRAGTDVVMYQYEDAASRRAVEASGARLGVGSFSDIAYLEHVGVKAFNWGVGYGGNYHSEAGYACLSDTFAMVARYLRFHKRNAGAVMRHEPAPAYAGNGSHDYRAGRCEVCFAADAVDFYTDVCSVCGTCNDCLEHYADCQCYTPATVSRPDNTSWPADNESLDDALAGARAAWDAGEFDRRVTAVKAAAPSVIVPAGCTCRPRRTFGHVGDCPRRLGLIAAGSQ
jgi:hypothetical protein